MSSIALPAPVWLLYVFLILTFVLHVIPMSVTLGGGFWVILAARRGRREPELAPLAHRLARWLPIWTAATVSTGVATLLFLQTLYGDLFYSAAVVIAWPWLSVVALVIVGYYGTYFAAYRQERAPWWVGAVAWLLFVGVGFIYTNQMTLMLSLDAMAAAHAADPSGWNLNLGEPTLWPRFLHMLVGAIAVAGLWVAAVGALAHGRGESGGESLLRLGARGFVGATAIEVLLGLWWLLALPGDSWRQYVGGDAGATGHLVASLVLTAGAVVAIWRAPGSDRPFRRVIVGAAHVALVVLTMVSMRDSVRRGILDIDFAAIHTSPQWGAILLFLALLTAAVVTIGWMVRQVVRAR